MRLLSLFLAACGARPTSMVPQLPPSQAPPGFWDQWGDGQAELDGYHLTTRRYGELRQGEAVEVWVTEDFTAGQRVKSDGGHGDEYPVLKLNDVRRFQTGIYDYHLLQSVFVRLDGRQPLGLPTKTVLSVDEWCGAMFEQLALDPETLIGTRHSYFDGEGDQQWTESIPDHAVLADTLPYLARGLAGDPIAPGQTVDVQLRLSLIDQRLAHRPRQYSPAHLTRAADVESIEVPAGTFAVRRLDVAIDDPGCAEAPANPIAGDGTACHQTYWVEEAPPHRIVRWTRENGEDATLTGSIRSPYWSEHGEGQEDLRLKLGLPRLPGEAP